MSITNTPPPLEGLAAIELWKKGKEEWNKWVEEHPDTPVSFEDVDFSHHTTPEKGTNFEGFHFPNAFLRFTDTKFGDGDVSFHKAKFGDGDVSFTNAKFGDGGVLFHNAQFGDGNVSFNNAEFGDGGVWFKHTQFGDGNVHFMSAKFGKGDASFEGAQFGDGNVSFNYAQFGDRGASFSSANFGDGSVTFHNAQFGDGGAWFNQAKFGDGDVSFDDAQFGDRGVSFSNAQFGDGNVSFTNAKFGDGYVSFNGAKFGDGNVSFINAKFGDEDVSFANAKFGDGNVSFHNAKFGDGNVSFHNAEFGDVVMLFTQMAVKGNFYFEPEQIRNCSELTFRGTQFDGSLTLHNINVGCVIDLRNTKISRPIDLDNVKTTFLTEKRFGLFHRAKSASDTTCYRRLKKLAKEADDHDSALEFFAQEKRSGYWHDVRGAELLFYYAYDFVSNFGRSISRPLMGLFLTWFAFAEAYWLFRDELDTPPTSAGLLSMGHSIPFYLGSRDTISHSLAALYGQDIPAWIHVAAVGQSVISGIFLFLIALALRNLSRT
jgi:hypothetical protein